MKMFLLRLLMGVFFVGFVYERLTRKYVQVSQLNMVIGKPGCGKSTTYAKLAAVYGAKHYHIFGTEEITVYIKGKKKGEKIPIHVEPIEANKLFRYAFPENSVLLLDEMGVWAHNRNFKQFDKRNVHFFKRYRHNKNMIIWCFSQSFDVDLTIRNLVSQFWVCEKYLRCWSVMRRLIMKPVVVHPQGDAPSSIQDDFVEDPRLLRPVLGGLKVTFIPRWCDSFDTYEMPEEDLKERDIDLTDVPLSVPVPLSFRASVKAKRRERVERARQAYYGFRVQLTSDLARFKKVWNKSR